MNEEFELWPYHTMAERGIKATDEQLDRMEEWAEEYPNPEDLMILARTAADPHDPEHMKFSGFLNTKIGVFFGPDCEPRKPEEFAEIDQISMTNLVDGLSKRFQIVSLHSDEERLSEVFFRELESFAKMNPFHPEVRKAFDFDSFEAGSYPVIAAMCALPKEEIERVRTKVAQYDADKAFYEAEREELFNQADQKCAAQIEILTRHEREPWQIRRNPDGRMIEVKFHDMDLEKMPESDREKLEELRSEVFGIQDEIKALYQKIQDVTEGISAGYIRNKARPSYGQEGAGSLIKYLREKGSPDSRNVPVYDRKAWFHLQEEAWAVYGDNGKLRAMAEDYAAAPESRKEFAEKFGLRTLARIEELERGITEGVSRHLGDVGTQAVGAFFLGWDEESAPAIHSPYEFRYCEKQYGSASSEISELLLGREEEIGAIIHGRPGPLSDDEKDSLREIGSECAKLVEQIDEDINQGRGGVKI